MAAPFPPRHHSAAAVAWLTHLVCAGWQSTPVVNIFKQCDVESKKDCVLSGKVGLRMVRVRRCQQQHRTACSQPVQHSPTNCLLLLFSQDDVIHKKVFRIVGSIPAVNFLKIPKDKPLGLTGRFLYLQVGWCHVLAGPLQQQQPP